MLRSLLDNSVLPFQKELLVGVAVLLFVYILGKLFDHFTGNYPPDPIGIPFFGYLPFLTNNAHLKCKELAEKYGDVFSLTLGSEPVIVLSSGEVIREAFAKPEFLGRPPFSAVSLFKLESPFFSHNLKSWFEQRRFVLQSMKDHGLGRSKVEGHITDEIRNLTNAAKKENGKPFDPLPILTASTSNNITAVVFGKRYDYEDPERKLLDNNLEEGSKAIGQTSAHIFFPWLKHFPLLLKLFSYDKARDCFRGSENIFRKKIATHKTTVDPNSADDFIDSYLVEMKARKQRDPNTSFSDTMLIGCVMDLFGAGTETVRSTIRWCLYIMADHVNVQRKVQREIDEVLGSEKSPEFKYQREMPYSHAVLLEVMRWKSVVPLNLLRYTTGETTVGGYTIPQGVIVMANFHAAHYDARVWKDPETFNPDRFLSSDKSTVIKTNDFMPFSVGKRACPGEMMANMEVFLYFITILQQFNVAFPEGFTPTYDTELTITYRLKPYNIRLIPRN